jgi:hypothetical protein
MYKARLETRNNLAFTMTIPVYVALKMRQMKWLCCIFLILFSDPAGADKKAPGMKAWVIEKNSSLIIKGSSNINEFTCNVKQYMNQDTLVFFTDEKGKRLVFQRSALTVEVSQFDCHHKFITADLRKTLKYQQYPNMKIHFISMEDPTVVNQGHSVKGIVDIELAGVVRRMELVYAVSNQHDKYIDLTGSRQMHFSDFKLVPPKKMAGLIKINEDILVKVQLKFRKIT